MRTISLAMAAVALTAFASQAQAEASKSTQDFVHKADIGNQFEIMSSQVALDKTKDANIKKIAQEMIDDHTKAEDQFKSTLASSTADPSLATGVLDDKHQKMLNKLKGESGKKFDQDYIDAQNSAHKEALSLYRDYAESGDDPALKDYASQTLPTLEQHAEDIKELKPSLASRLFQ